MASSLLLGLLFFIFQNHGALTQEVNGPPKVDGSYIAVGEVLTFLDGDRIQSKFDETFDANSGNAAFIVYTMGKNITYIEDNSIGQTLQYSDGACNVITVEDWIEVPAPPSLMGYTDTDGKIRFSLKQLFNIPDRYLVAEEAGQGTTYRDLPAVSWRYRIESLLEDGAMSVVDIYVVWSNGTWATTTSSGQVPLGYEITRLIHDKSDKKMVHTEQYLNVFSFVRNAANQKALEPRTGIHCKDRKSLFVFPELSKAKAISFKSEVIFPDDSEVKTMDVWYDMENGFLRVDMDRLDNQEPMFKEKRYSSGITSKNRDTTYEIDIFKGKVRCRAMKTENYEMDIQEIINPKLDLKFWSIDTFFSRNTTSWTYIGRTTKRNIPCHLFQGFRKDWPEQDSNMESLWEWCVVAEFSPEFEQVNFKDDGEIGLVSLQIKFNQTTPIISENKIGTIIHHFYDVLEEDPANLDVSTFDISKCFQPDNQRRLEFVVDIKIDKSNMQLVEDATSDVRFLGTWKYAISEKSKLPLSTLRVANIDLMVWNNALLVSFTVLGVHPDLTMNVEQKHPTLEEAINSLNTSINNNELEIKYSWKKDEEAVPLKALKNTMNYIIKEPDEFPTIPPFTTSSPDATGSGGTDNPDITKSTDNPDITKSTDNPDGTKSPSTLSASTGHGSGTVAGVSIAMLLIGGTMGAGGIFYKYKGIPRFR